MNECHCGKDGHPLGSINCPVHGTWRPIETAPKDGTTILLYDRGWSQPWRTIVAARWVWQKSRFESGDFVHHSATHWMSLPAPPVQ